MSDQPRVLRKSRDKVIGGVCGGLAEYLGWDPSKFRLAYVLVSILSAAFPGTLVYIVLWLCMPNPEESRQDHVDLYADRKRGESASPESGE